MTKLEERLNDLAYSYETPQHRGCYGCCQSDSDYEKAFKSGARAALEMPELKALIKSFDIILNDACVPLIRTVNFNSAKKNIDQWRIFIGDESNSSETPNSSNLKEPITSSPAIEVIPNTWGESCMCGSTEFAIAPDMKATRHCVQCGNSWIPS